MVQKVGSSYLKKYPVNDKDSYDVILTVDTTVQDKSITYPTDTKLYQRVNIHDSKRWLRYLHNTKD